MNNLPFLQKTQEIVNQFKIKESEICKMENDVIEIIIKDNNNFQIKGSERQRKLTSQNRASKKLRNILDKNKFPRKPEKVFEVYTCNCVTKCYEKVGLENVKKQFEKFYSASSHEAEVALINSMVSEVPIKRKRVKNSEKRKCTRLYKICGTVVCKPFFLHTFKISACKVDHALKKMKSRCAVSDEISCKYKKLSQDQLKKMFNHIESFIPEVEVYEVLP